MGNYKKKFIIALLFIVIAMTFSAPVYAAGNVSAAIESTWGDAAEQIKTITDNVIFPAVDLVLAILFFVKLGTCYFDYKKHGQFEFTGPAILFAGLIFTLTAPLYIWNILGI